MELGDTTLFIGYSEVGTQWIPDTIAYNGENYTNESPGLEYQRTAWKYIPGFTFKSGISFKVDKNINVYTNTAPGK